MAEILQMSPLAYVPHFLIKKAILSPLRKQTSGTIMVSVIMYVVSNIMFKLRT